MKRRHGMAVIPLVLGLVLVGPVRGIAAQSYTVSAMGPVSVQLPAASTPGDAFVRGANGAWHRVEVVADGTRIRLDLSAADVSATGGALLVPAKPRWMTLDDDVAPTLVAARAGDRLLAPVDAGVDAGTVATDTLTLSFECVDDANPLDPAVEVSLANDFPGPRPTLTTAGLDGSSRQGQISLHFGALAPGSYRGLIRVRDRSPLGNALRLPWTFRVLGIATVADRSRVRLTTSVGDFVFQAGIEQQLRLPDGRWAKLTTCIDGTWLYPRKITAIDGPHSVHQGQCVTVTASAQGLDGKPVDGRGRIEYAFTVRADVPALLVASRSVNLLPGPAKVEANWGWLAGDHYVTPTGHCEWTGKATDRYVTIATPGWLWLAPPRGSGPDGLAWVSPLRFGESRFDTMLLYGVGRSCGPEQSVDMEYAIAPADTPEKAAALAAQLTALRLLLPTAAP